MSVTGFKGGFVPFADNPANSELITPLGNNSIEALSVTENSEPVVEISGFANGVLQELGAGVANVAAGDTGALSQQFAMAKANIDAAVSKAAELGVTTIGVDTAAIDGVAAAISPTDKAKAIEEASKAVAAGERLISEVTQAEFAKGVMDGINNITAVGSAIVGGFTVAGHEAYKHLDGVISAAIPGMKHLVTGGINNLENGFGALVTNYQGLPQQFVPQQGVPDLIGKAAGFSLNA